MVNDASSRRKRATVQGPGVGRVLAVPRDQPRTVEQPGDRLHPTGIAGQKNNLADVARFAADVVLQIPIADVSLRCAPPPPGAHAEGEGIAY